MGKKELIQRIDKFISKMRYLKKDFAEERGKAQKIAQQWKKESPKIYSIKKPSYYNPKDPFAVKTVKVKR